MGQKERAYDGSGYPTDLDNFMAGLSDARLVTSVSNFTSTMRGPGLHGKQYTHHIDHESSSTDGKWQFFSIAGNSGGTKATKNAPKGSTPYLCHLGILNELYDDVPDNFASLLRAAFFDSRIDDLSCDTRWVIADGSFYETREAAIEAQAILQAKKNGPGRAPNGKLFWDFENWGPPITQEHYNTYETRKEMLNVKPKDTPTDTPKDTPKDKPKGKKKRNAE